MYKKFEFSDKGYANTKLGLSKLPSQKSELSLNYELHSLPFFYQDYILLNSSQNELICIDNIDFSEKWKFKDTFSKTLFYQDYILLQETSEKDEWENIIKLIDIHSGNFIKDIETNVEWLIEAITDNDFIIKSGNVDGQLFLQKHEPYDLIKDNEKLSWQVALPYEDVSRLLLDKQSLIFAVDDSGIVCYDWERGIYKWEANPFNDFSDSHIICGDLVLMAIDNIMIAYDLHNGVKIWEKEFNTDISDFTSYIDQNIYMLTQDKYLLIDSKNGETIFALSLKNILHKYGLSIGDLMNSKITITEDSIFFPVKRTGDIFMVKKLCNEIIWHHKHKNSISGYQLITTRNRLYCLDMTGKLLIFSF